MTFKKKRSHPELTDAVRKSCAYEVIDLVHRNGPALVAAGLATFWTFSCERGTDPKFGHNLHNQGCLWWWSRHGVDTAIKSCKAFLKACCLREDVSYVVHLEQKGVGQSEGDQAYYPEKEEDEDNGWYRNEHGGPDYPDEARRAEWKHYYRERRSNVRGYGFAKSGFAAAAGRSKRVQITNSNATVLAISFAQRTGLDTLGASILRRLSWMIQTGDYECSQQLVCGKYGGSMDRGRFEALAVVNEEPRSRGGDMRIISIIFCGTMSERDDALLRDIVLRPPFMMAAGSHIEEFDLFDAECFRDSGCKPERFADVAPVTRPIGNAIVVDMGFHAEERPFSKLAVQTLREFQFETANMLNEKTKVVDRNGYFNCGMISQIFDNILRQPGRMLESYVPDFARLFMSELLVYNTTAYFNYVEKAKGAGVSDIPSLLEKLGFLKQIEAIGRGGTFHGVVDSSSFQQLVSSTVVVSQQYGFNVAIVRAGDDDSSYHHFSAVWFLRRTSWVNINPPSIPLGDAS